MNGCTLENISSWPVGLKAVVIGFVFFSTSFLGCFFVSRGQVKVLKKTVLKTESLKRSLERKKRIANVSLYATQVKTLTEQYNKQVKLLATCSDLTNFLEKISNIGVASGIVINSIKPLAKVQNGFYSELPMLISATGSYQQIAQFISDVSWVRPIVTFYGFKLRAVKSTEQLTLDVTAKAYSRLRFSASVAQQSGCLN